MAWPWTWESNFELGTNGEWASETDTGALLDFPHYTQLASQHAQAAAIPFEGAYCMRIEASDANDHYVTRTDAVVAVNSSAWFRFMFMVGGGWVTTTTTATVAIFRLMGGATTTVICSVGMRVGRVNSTSIELGVGGSVPTVFDPVTNFRTNLWHTVEVNVVTATDATSNDGANTLYVDGFQVATVGSLVQTVAATVLRFGLLDTLAANTGLLLYDRAIQDEDRLGPVMEDDRWSETRVFTRSGHIFVGPGRIDNLTVRATAVTTSVVTLVDTDQAGTTSQSKVRGFVTVATSGDTVDLAGVPLYFNKGCYAIITPTAIASTPIVTVTFQAQAESSQSAKRAYGQKTTLRPGDTI